MTTENDLQTEIQLPEQFQKEIIDIFDSIPRVMSNRANDHFILLGKVVHCHQYLEIHILDYIKKMNPNIGSIENIARYLSQKVTLASEMKETLLTPYLCKGINELNKLRNKFSHKIEITTIDSNEMPTIINIVDQFKLKLTLEPIEYIQIFVGIVAAILEIGFYLKNKLDEINSEIVYDKIRSEVIADIFG